MDIIAKLVGGLLAIGRSYLPMVAAIAAGKLASASHVSAYLMLLTAALACLFLWVALPLLLFLFVPAKQQTRGQMYDDADAILSSFYYIGVVLLVWAADKIRWPSLL